jgi:hypothetical protein
MKSALKEAAKAKKIVFHPATASEILADLKVSRSEMRIGKAAVAKYIQARGKKAVKSRKVEK